MTTASQMIRLSCSDDVRFQFCWNCGCEERTSPPHTPRHAAVACAPFDSIWVVVRYLAHSATALQELSGHSETCSSHLPRRHSSLLWLHVGLLRGQGPQTPSMVSLRHSLAVVAKQNQCDRFCIRFLCRPRHNNFDLYPYEYNYYKFKRIIFAFYHTYCQKYNNN